MPLQGQEFTQFSYLIDNKYEPKYKNRFILHIEAMPLLATDFTAKQDAAMKQTSGLLIALDAAKRPAYNVGPKEIPRFNEKSFYAGTPEMDNKMSCEFWDYINNQVGPTVDGEGGGAAELIYRWFNTVYNIERGSQGFKSDYATNAHLYLLDPHGDEIEHWFYINFWPLSVDYGELSYSSPDHVKITCEFQYDKAKLIATKDSTPETVDTTNYLTRAGETPTEANISATEEAGIAEI